MPATVTPSHPAAVAVEDRMFRALLWLRLIVLGNVLVLNWYRRDNFAHPTAGLLVLAGLTAWTVFVLWAYADRRRRVPIILVADLGVAVAAILVSPQIKGDGLSATIPGFWVMAVVLAWGVHWRWLGGLVAAAVVSLADLYIRLPDITQTNYANVFLLMLGGPIVGYLCGSLQQMAAERDEAERAVATAQERARLARAVHDGVLQVLALVQRRGAEIGGQTEELGRLAGEQESALRALIREQEAVRAPGDTTSNLAVALDRLATHRPKVSVALPGHGVRLPAHAAAELVDAVNAALDNIVVHVGDDAQAWVLLEDLGDRVVVTVRDEGPGIPAGRLEQAAAHGRLGVSDSIRGRIRDLGGAAELTTGSFGTEWEFTVPRATAR
jgi:signal transduction histidine kinase